MVLVNYINRGVSAPHLQTLLRWTGETRMDIGPDPAAPDRPAPANSAEHKPHKPQRQKLAEREGTRGGR